MHILDCTIILILKKMLTLKSVIYRYVTVFIFKKVTIWMTSK